MSGSVSHAGGVGGGRSSFSLRSTDLRGRRTGRAPISRAYLGADYYFWLLDLDTACSHGPRLPHGSGDPLSDLVAEETARVCGAIRLWGGEHDDGGGFGGVPIWPFRSSESGSGHGSGINND